MDFCNVAYVPLLSFILVSDDDQFGFGLFAFEEEGTFDCLSKMKLLKYFGITSPPFAGTAKEHDIRNSQLSIYDGNFARVVGAIAIVN